MDYYDVTAIDGVNVPVEMKPDPLSSPLEKLEDPCEYASATEKPTRSKTQFNQRGRLCMKETKHVHTAMAAAIYLVRSIAGYSHESTTRC